MLCCFVLENAKSVDIGKLEPKLENAVKTSIHETKKAGEHSIIQTLGKMPSTRIAISFWVKFHRSSFLTCVNLLKFDFFSCTI